ncbi:hypothetical protein CAEBREN_11221 [Caenorhabditis brenneri]|uniref:Uncharacterized protein n=1 Tax=Caenorhabditis brenneri TaxID=135651 RepID=G0N573_CAEBE|nr:hypothetical protein CAEBREN_11221 [Caenorhabditis brenneri]
MIYIIFFITIIGFSYEQPPDSPVGIIAQSKNSSLGSLIMVNNTENIDSSMVPPVGTLEKYHNASEPSYLYIVQLELKTSRVEESFSELESRLNKLIDMAFILAGYKHRKQTPPAEITTNSSIYNTKVGLSLSEYPMIEVP